MRGRSISPHGGGDGGRAARASLLTRPAISIRLDPISMALLRCVAASRRVSINAVISEACADYLGALLPSMKKDA